MISRVILCCVWDIQINCHLCRAPIALITIEFFFSNVLLFFSKPPQLFSKAPINFL